MVENPQGTIAPLALRNQLSCQWNVLGPLHGAYQQYPWRSSQRPDVNLCIGEWAGVSGEEDVVPLSRKCMRSLQVVNGTFYFQLDLVNQIGTCSVGFELLEYVQEQDRGTTETVSEAPGVYGCCGGNHAAGAAPYETA